jgi:hypothetical protein
MSDRPPSGHVINNGNFFKLKNHAFNIPPQYVYNKVILASTWDTIVREAEALAPLEPIMKNTFWRYIFARGSLGHALSYMIADAFDGIIPAE